MSNELLLAIIGSSGVSALMTRFIEIFVRKAENKRQEQKEIRKKRFDFTVSAYQRLTNAASYYSSVINYAEEALDENENNGHRLEMMEEIIKRVSPLVENMEMEDLNLISFYFPSMDEKYLNNLSSLIEGGIGILPHLTMVVELRSSESDVDTKEQIQHHMEALHACFESVNEGLEVLKRMMDHMINKVGAGVLK